MNKKQFIHFILALSLFGCIIFPKTIFAASIYFNAGSRAIYSGDIFVVEVAFSSPTELINVIDGVFSFNQDILEVKELSTGASIFSLWAQSPTFSNETGRVSFVGGSINGYRGEGGIILKTIFRAKKAGSVSLNFQDGLLIFLGDGKGTKIDSQKKSLSISVLERPLEATPQDEWKTFVAEDKTAPKFIEAIVGKDPNIFNDRYFATFFATDQESGIAYYEVGESGYDFTRAESPYLLRDQSVDNVIRVKAVDAAGNETITTIGVPTAAIPYGRYPVWVLAALTGIIFFLALRRLIGFKLK